MISFSKKSLPWPVMLLTLTFLVFGIYSLTSGGHTAYDYFTRLAESFLHGKFYLEENPPWLNEMVPIGEGKYAIVYPPTPAIVAIPFVAIFRSDFYQEYLSWGMGALAALIWGLISFKLTSSKKISFWFFVTCAFGNIIWYLAATGSVWYLGQVSGFLFLSLTIYQSIRGKNIFWVAFYFGLAVLSRLQVFLAFPLILYLNRDKIRNSKNIIVGGLTFGAFIAWYGFYNYQRFGSFIETGYSLIPGVLTEPWYSKGIFHYSYVRDNLRAMFLTLPNFKNTFPFITPSWGGLSILITSPVFIYILFAKLKNLTNIMTWISLLSVAGVVLTHGGTGFTQFGYRYAVDFYPLILFLLLSVIKDKGIKWQHWFFLFLAIIVNAWGVIFINKLGFVSF